MRCWKFRAYLEPAGSEYPVKEPRNVPVLQAGPLCSFPVHCPFLGSLPLLLHPSVGNTFPDSCMQGHRYVQMWDLCSHIGPMLRRALHLMLCCCCLEIFNNL